MGIIETVVLVFLFFRYVYPKLRRADEGLPLTKPRSEREWDAWFEMEKSHAHAVHSAGFVVDVSSYIAHVYQYDPNDGKGVATCRDALFGRAKTETPVKLALISAHSVWSNEHTYGSALLTSYMTVAQLGGPPVPEALASVPVGSYPTWNPQGA